MPSLTGNYSSVLQPGRGRGVTSSYADLPAPQPPLGYIVAYTPEQIADLMRPQYKGPEGGRPTSMEVSYSSACLIVVFIVVVT